MKWDPIFFFFFLFSMYRVHDFSSIDFGKIKICKSVDCLLSYNFNFCLLWCLEDEENFALRQIDVISFNVKLNRYFCINFSIFQKFIIWL